MAREILRRKCDEAALKCRLINNLRAQVAQTDQNEIHALIESLCGSEDDPIAVLHQPLQRYLEIIEAGTLDCTLSSCEAAHKLNLDVAKFRARFDFPEFL